MEKYKKCPKCNRFHGLTDKNYCTNCGGLLRIVTLFDGANTESPSEDEMSYSESNRAYIVRKLFNKHKTVVIAALAALVIVPTVFFSVYYSQGNIYGRVISALEKGDVEKALEISYKLHDDYNDSMQLESYCRARRNESADWYTYQRFIELGTYRDSAERAKTNGYEYAVLVINGEQSLDSNTVDNIETILQYLGNYKDSGDLLAKIPELRNEAKYTEAVRLYDSAEGTISQIAAGNYDVNSPLPAFPDYEQAADLFEQLGDYKDSYERLQNVRNAHSAASDIYTSIEAEAARQQEIAEREQKARDSLDLAQKNIVGTWTRGELGEYSYNRSGDSNYTESYANIGDKAKFVDDGTVELYNGSNVITGRYFFEDIYLVIRVPALLGGETETKFTIFMDSDTAMEITEVGEDVIVDAEQDIFGFGSTYKTFYPTIYTKQ